MLLSAHENLLGDRPLEEKWALLEEYGYDGIDLVAPNVPSRAELIKKLAADSKLKPAVLYSRLQPLSLLAPDIETRYRAVEALKDRLRWAAQIGAFGVIVVPVFGPAQILDTGPLVPQRTTEIALTVLLLTELAHWAHEHTPDVRLILEPVNRSESHLLYEPAEAAIIARQIASLNLSTLLDFYHIDIEQQDIHELAAAVADVLSLVHLADLGRVVPGAANPGRDWVAWFRPLRQAGYDGWFGLECKPPAAPEQLRAAAVLLREAWTQAGSS